MSLNPDAPCPVDHVVYLSAMLADNAVILHKMIHCTNNEDGSAECKGIEKFQHGDHWHIGHETGTKHLCPPRVPLQRFTSKV